MTKTEIKKELLNLITEFFNETDNEKASKIKDTIFEKVLACPYGENGLGVVKDSLSMWSENISSYLTQKDKSSTQQAYLALMGVATIPDISFLED